MRPVIVLAALDREADLVKPLQPMGVSVHVSGMGSRAARAAAESAAKANPCGLISWGFAGALDGSLRAGQLLVPDKVLSAEGEPYPVHEGWALGIRQILSTHRPVSGILLEVNQPLTTGAEKAAAAGSGAIACDMESAAILAVARERQLPAIVLRVIVDQLDDELPGPVRALTDDRGRLIAGRFASLLTRPAVWSSLIVVAMRYRKARKSMGRLVASMSRGSQGVHPV